MNSIELQNYNLHWTLMGGQAFNWDYEPEENTYWGFTQDKAIKLQYIKKDSNTQLLWQTYPQKDNYEFLKNYLRLNEPYDSILKKINKDKHVGTAITKYPDLRLLKQDLEQTIISFILSANNNIPNIRRAVRKLSLNFGEKITLDNKELYLFPKIEKIAEAGLEELLETRIGFRAKYIKSSAEHLIKNNLPLKIKNETEAETRKHLTEMKGVGNKIADCIMVFSLAYDNITPLDVWAKRVFVELYKLDPKMKYDSMRRWIDEYFDGHAAWAGQFLFEYIRNEKKLNAK